MKRLTRNDSFTLIGAQANVIANNLYGKTRAVIVMTNTNAAGGETVYLANGAEAKANSGIPCAAGQSISFAIDGRYTPSSKEWTCYSAAGGTVMAIYEEILD